MTLRRYRIEWTWGNGQATAEIIEAANAADAIAISREMNSWFNMQLVRVDTISERESEPKPLAKLLMVAEPLAPEGDWFLKPNGGEDS